MFESQYAADIDGMWKAINIATRGGGRCLIFLKKNTYTHTYICMYVYLGKEKDGETVMTTFPNSIFVPFGSCSCSFSPLPPPSADNDSNEITQEHTWTVISSFFDEKGLVRQQLDSFKTFVANTCQEIIDESPEIVVAPENQYGPEGESSEVQVWERCRHGLDVLTHTTHASPQPCLGGRGESRHLASMPGLSVAHLYS